MPEPIWDPVAEARKRYPGLTAEDAPVIVNYLSRPDNFRSAFPEYAGLSDSDIINNMRQFGGKPYVPQDTGLPVPPENWADIAGEYGGTAGGTVGGLAGGVPGAVAGGVAGQTIGRGIQARYGTRDVPATPFEAAIDVARAGAEQGAFEFGGRAIAGVGGRALKAGGAKLGISAPPPVLSETIGNVRVPETMGQLYGKPGGLTQTVEHYLSGTFVGRPFRAVAQAQEQAARDIMADLSKAPAASGRELAANWARAREATRITASPLYDSLSAVPVPTANTVARSILDDPALRLSTKAKDALIPIAVDPDDGIAQALGYKNAQQALAKMGQKAFNATKLQMQQQGVGLAPTITADKVLAARHELGDLASSARDPNDRRLFSEAWRKLDSALNTAMTPQQMQTKQEADLLWRRSYIMDRVGRSLQRMENVQNPAEAAKVLPQRFAQMVNQLARQPITRDAAGNIVSKPSELDVLFTDPADKRAMVDLANFLTTKYSTLHGAENLGMALAHIGTTIQAMHVPLQVATGNIGGATRATASLLGLFGLSHVLASPGGAVLVRDYFHSPAAGFIPLMLRIGVEAAKGSGESPGPPPAP